MNKISKIDVATAWRVSWGSRSRARCPCYQSCDRIHPSPRGVSTGVGVGSVTLGDSVKVAVVGVDVAVADGVMLGVVGVGDAVRLIVTVLVVAVEVGVPVSIVGVAVKVAVVGIAVALEVGLGTVSEGVDVGKLGETVGEGVGVGSPVSKNPK